MIKPMFPEQTLVRVCLVITVTVQTFKYIQTQFTFLYFKSGRIDFIICLVAPLKLAVVTNLF